MKDYISVKIDMAPVNVIPHYALQSIVLLDFAKVKAKTKCNLNFVAEEILSNLNGDIPRDPGSAKGFIRGGSNNTNPWCILYFTHDENIDPIPIKIYSYMTAKDVIKTYEVAYKAAVAIEDVRRKAEEKVTINDLV